MDQFEVDHMKVFKVDKLERIPNKTHDDFKKQIWGPRRLFCYK